MTAPRYRAPNNAEIAAIRETAPTGPDTATKDKDGNPRMITADAQPASSDATRYFQTAAITGTTPNWIGRPAYQNAGIVRIQKDAVQATAIPAGPHGSATINRSPVTTNSTTPQRNQRSALPMERWIDGSNRACRREA